MLASVTRCEDMSADSLDWQHSPWPAIEPLRLDNHMGERPEHFPGVEAKVAYDDAAVHVVFRAKDRYVRAVAEAHQGSVYEDSCVEFFFTPGPDVSRGYFNLEMNCGGIMLFHFNGKPRADTVVLPKRECDAITVAHSLPRIVEPEIEDAVTWTVGYSVPLDLLRQYTVVETPKPETTWRANFYKCADGTSHPHWLTWSPVDAPAPDFHLPDSFGVLRFE